MQINKRIVKGLLGGLVAFLGPTIGFFIYSLFFGYYVNSLTIIPFVFICSIITLIMVIILEKFVFKKIN
jgi:hypothetical protein